MRNRTLERTHVNHWVGENFGQVPTCLNKLSGRINVNSIDNPSPSRDSFTAHNNLSSLWHIYKIFLLSPQKYIVWSSLDAFVPSKFVVLYKKMINKVFSLVNQTFRVPLWKLSVFLFAFQLPKLFPRGTPKQRTMWIFTLSFVAFDWFASYLPVPRDFSHCFSANQLRIGVWFPWRLGAWHISCFRFDNIYHPCTAHADKNFSCEFRFWLAKYSPRQKPWISNSF